MEIKSFKVKIDDLGNYQFIDKKDEEAFKRTLSFLSKTKNIEKLELCIKSIEEDPTEKQFKFLRILFRKIAEESGEDYSSIKQNIIQRLGYQDLDDVPKEKVNELIELSIYIAKEYFNLNVHINPNNNNIEFL